MSNVGLDRAEVARRMLMGSLGRGEAGEKRAAGREDDAVDEVRRR